METAGRKQAHYSLADAGLPLGEMGAFAVTRISGVCKDLTTENGKAGLWTTGVHRGGEACGNWPRMDAGPLCPCSLSNGTVSLTPPSDRHLRWGLSQSRVPSIWGSVSSSFPAKGN